MYLIVVTNKHSFILTYQTWSLFNRGHLLKFEIIYSFFLIVLPTCRRSVVYLPKVKVQWMKIHLNKHKHSRWQQQMTAAAPKAWERVTHREQYICRLFLRSLLLQATLSTVNTKVIVIIHDWRNNISIVPSIFKSYHNIHKC